VLQHGAPLLASGGTEFDEPFDDQGDPKQRLAKQRKILEQRAGLADVGGFGDLVDEDDLVLHPTESEEQKRARLYVDALSLLMPYDYIVLALTHVLVIAFLR